MSLTNLCRSSSTTISRSITHSGTFRQTGSAGDDVDGNASTAYGGSASVSSGTASKSIEFYGYGNGGGQYGGSGSVLFYEIQAWATVTSCAISGSVSSNAADVDIRIGGDTLIYTLTNDTFVSSISTISTALISGMSGTGNWSSVKSALSSSNFTRVSDTVVSCMLPAVPAYSISANETVACDVPASALTSGAAITSDNTFSILYTGLSSVSGAIVHVNDPSSHGGYVSTAGIASPSVSFGGGYACVQGAMHVCPIPGHGTTAITAITTKSYINGKLILTTESVAGCGAKIYPPDRKVYVEA